MTKSINEIRLLLKDGELSKEEFEQLALDPRKGVQRLVSSYQKRQEKKAVQTAFFNERWQNELKLRTKYPIIAGIDEVGRGPLAGPVVTAAVVLPIDFFEPEINDSKQLSATLREQLYRKIMQEALAVNLGIASPEMIDRENIYHATELIMADAVSGLRIQPDFLLVDAMTIPLDIAQKKLIKGDAKSISIGAASIVAKVVRDHLMKMYDQVFPGYDFAENMGYGTKKHLDGLDQYGITPIHRKTFAPVKNMI